jgi:hypothetical protein
MHETLVEEDEETLPKVFIFSEHVGSSKDLET